MRLLPFAEMSMPALAADKSILPLVVCQIGQTGCIVGELHIEHLRCQVIET
jgi:hypothetical protein